MYFPVLLWSLVIFASFWGYGEALRRALKRPEFEDLGWGLTAAWGMAVTLAIGGFLMMLSLAKAPVLTGVVLAGATFALYFFARRLTSATAPQPASKKSKSKKGKTTEERTSPPTQATKAGYPAVIANTLIWGLAALAFASSIAWPHHIDPNDDLVCYLMLPQKILATGTLIEPFSFQRAGTFGGQSLLQALVMIFGDETNGHVPDRGIAMLILFGILTHLVRNLRGMSAAVAFLVLFAYWFIPVPRISTHGAMTGGCILVAFLETLRRVNSLALSSRAYLHFVPLAFLVTGACSIRPTFTVVLAAFFIGYALKLFLDRTNLQKQKEFFTIFVAVVVGGLLLVPFMVVLYFSNGTPIIPPFSGNVSKAYQGMYDFASPADKLETLLNFLKTPEIIALAVMLAIAAIVSGSAERRWILGCVSLACLFLLYRFGALVFLDLYRLIYPIAMPVAFYCLITALRPESLDQLSKSKRFFARPIPLAAAFAAILLIFVNAKQGYAELAAQCLSTVQQTKEKASFLDPRLKGCYSEVQSTVPRGKPIMTMVDASYWLDYARNPMASINIVGGSSPPPGLPIGSGADALRDYLKGQGYRYFIAVDFNNAVLLYTRRLWTVATRPERFYREIWRPRFLDVMNNIDQWDREGRVIKRSGNLRLFDLGQD